MRHDQPFLHRAFRRSHKIIPSIVGAAAAATCRAEPMPLSALPGLLHGKRSTDGRPIRPGIGDSGSGQSCRPAGAGGSRDSAHCHPVCGTIRLSAIAPSGAPTRSFLPLWERRQPRPKGIPWRDRTPPTPFQLQNRSRTSRNSHPEASSCAVACRSCPVPAWSRRGRSSRGRRYRPGSARHCARRRIPRHRRCC